MLLIVNAIMDPLGLDVYSPVPVIIDLPAQLPVNGYLDSLFNHVPCLIDDGSSLYINYKAVRITRL